ncbi:hypothetical protein D9619_003841 [Psilocybe cf. subviscida]|uniref:Tc1-like transposase DDE domain-containing protein n=1 Tax=Psilocybe cf. subviscida TaxID=2480587 RepID=A0A8H5AW50_9AGAR|nr:hypothetical protein D9619_003841 [Psilocybe cf. subviscida]
MPASGVRELSPATRGRILALHDENYSYREISEKIGGFSKSTAWKTVNRYKTYNTTDSLPRSGRPKAISNRTRRQVLREVTGNRWEPYSSISRRLNTVTEHQIREIAAAAGYHRRIARRKPFISDRSIMKRIQWAEINAETDWTKIIWTDETSFKTGKRPGHRYVTRRAGEEYLPENIDPTFRSGRKTLMVWACITHNRKGPIIRIKTVPQLTDENGKKKGGGLNAERYAKQIVSGPLKRFWASVEKDTGPGVCVVEDGAPCHRGIPAKTAKIKAGFPIMDHPPSSPDLNPIEPLWLLLKNCVADIPGSGNSVDALWAAIQKVWDGITVADIQKYTGKMEDRVEAVSEADGWQTRF